MPATTRHMSSTNASHLLYSKWFGTIPPDMYFATERTEFYIFEQQAYDGVRYLATRCPKSVEGFGDDEWPALEAAHIYDGYNALNDLLRHMDLAGAKRYR